jgi:hypothetical protein
MTSRDMGDSTVRMREYVGYIIIFMGTGLPASLSSLLRRNAGDTFGSRCATNAVIPAELGGIGDYSTYSTRNFSRYIVDPRLSVGRQK